MLKGATQHSTTTQTKQHARPINALIRFLFCFRKCSRGGMSHHTTRIFPKEHTVAYEFSLNTEPWKVWLQ